MASLTYRQVLNRVLRLLSEDEIEDSVTELTEAYHKLLGEFVNQIKEEIEAAHQWRALIVDGNAIIDGGFETATITEVDARARLVRMQDAECGQYVPLAWDVTDTNNPLPLQEYNYDYTLYRSNSDDNTPADSIAGFSLAPDTTDSSTLVLYVFPPQTTSKVVLLKMVQPQAYLDVNDLDTIIQIPTTPLIIGSVYYALAERGEELGVNNLYTEERYRNALDAAISGDNAEKGELVLIPA